MNFSNKVLVVGLFVAISLLSASDARAGKRSRTGFGAQGITASVARQSTAPITPSCADQKPGCYNCTTKGKCDAGATTLTPDGSCSPNEACIVVGSVPVCKPIAQTKCNCGGNRQGCDPFAVNQPIFCVAGKVYKAETCASGQKCSGAGQCVADTSSPAAVCTGTKPEFQLVTPACTTGVFCDGMQVVETIKCKEKTEYFDLKSYSCKAFPPPNPCGCGKARCPIIATNCTKYALCDGNTLIDEESCTGNDKFDFINQACAAAATGPCLPYQNCTFSSGSSSSGSSSSGSSSGSTSTATTKPPTCDATNAGKRYPHETEKCKKYYTCRKISGTKYQYVEGTCLEDLVFDPTSTTCDKAEKVPGCQ